MGLSKHQAGRTLRAPMVFLLATFVLALAGFACDCDGQEHGSGYRKRNKGHSVVEEFNRFAGVVGRDIVGPYAVYGGSSALPPAFVGVCWEDGCCYRQANLGFAVPCRHTGQPGRFRFSHSGAAACFDLGTVADPEAVSCGDSPPSCAGATLRECTVVDRGEFRLGAQKYRSGELFEVWAEYCDSPTGDCVESAYATVGGNRWDRRITSCFIASLECEGQRLGCEVRESSELAREMLDIALALSLSQRCYPQPR